MISFAQDTVTRVRAVVAEDAYGNAVPASWADASRVEISGCRMQPLASSEYTVDQERTISRWRIFAPDWADIRSSDRIEWGGMVLEVEGDAQLWSSPTGALAHLEATLRRS